MLLLFLLQQLIHSHHLDITHHKDNERTPLRRVLRPLTFLIFQVSHQLISKDQFICYTYIKDQLSIYLYCHYISCVSTVDIQYKILNNVQHHYNKHHKNALINAGFFPLMTLVLPIFALRPLASKCFSNLQVQRVVHPQHQLAVQVPVGNQYETFVIMSLEQ